MKKHILFYFFGLVISIWACQSPNTAENLENESEVIVETPILESWNENPKARITDWVKMVTDETSSSFIAEKDRIAVFDNDGTLWSEQPMYFQLAFAIDEIKRMAPEHPEWKETAPFKDLLNGDIKGFLAGGERAITTLIGTTHGGMSTEEFNVAVNNWIHTAIHPGSGKHYNEMIFQPMLELLEYLRSNGFKTFIVSGGGIDFMRVWAEEAYGIPPYQVVGSVGGLSYEVVDGEPVLNKLSDIFFIDDKAGKPVGIYRNIGKRPVFAAGNSDGDYEMLQYTSTGPGERFGMYIHHTDSVREFAYDRDSHIGKLDKGLDDAAKYNWLVVDMAKDWKVVHPYELE